MKKVQVLIGAAFLALSLGEGRVAAETDAKPVLNAKSVQIEKVAVGTAIENRELLGEAKTFEESVPRVYCWTKVMTEHAPLKIKHVWYADGEKEAEVALDVNYSAVRTWSSKSIWPGSWKVDITNEVDEVLATSEFTVQPTKP
ncbi:MAG: DUF2914 domain-containing protein [Elusimicrobiota bacterium]|jgi:hypothetical protein